MPGLKITVVDEHIEQTGDRSQDEFLEVDEGMGLQLPEDATPVEEAEVAGVDGQTQIVEDQGSEDESLDQDAPDGDESDSPELRADMTTSVNIANLDSEGHKRVESSFIPAA